MKLRDRARARRLRQIELCEQKPGGICDALEAAERRQEQYKTWALRSGNPRIF